MVRRPVLGALVSLAVAACTASGSDSGPTVRDSSEADTFDAARAGAGAVAIEAAEPAVLELASKPRLTLVFGAQSLIEVRLLDEDGTPRPRAQVSFALVGRTHDASLSTLTAVTDEEGLARNTVMAGEAVATFQVRISAPGAEDVYVDVSISDAGFGTLVVSAAYEGSRAVVERTVVVQPGARCADTPLGAPGDPTSTLTDEDTAMFLALPAGAEYAVTAVASGAEGVVLATACVDAVLVEQDHETQVPIVFSDEPLTPTGHFVLQADLDTSVPAATLANALSLAAGTLIDADASGAPAPALADARFLLDSLEQTLRSDEYATTAAFAGVADALAAERATPTLAPDLLTSLQDALDTAGEGPTAAGTRLSELTAEGMGTTHLAAAMQIDRDNGELPITWQAQQLATDPLIEGGSGQSVDLSALDGATTTVAEFLADADVVDLVQARFPVAYGALAVQVMRKLAGDGARGDELRAEAGCATLESWLAQQPLGLDACTGDCVRAACDRALTRMMSAAETALLELDGRRPTLTLHGELSLDDSDGDLLAERMNTDLLWGGWDAEMEGADGDFVSGSATAALDALDAP